MKLILAIVVWLLIGGTIAAGVVLATKGSYWLLGLSLLAFGLLFVRYGCRSH